MVNGNCVPKQEFTTHNKCVCNISQNECSNNHQGTYCPDESQIAATTSESETSTESNTLSDEYETLDNYYWKVVYRQSGAITGRITK